jgi:putative hemin transport protein
VSTNLSEEKRAEVRAAVAEQPIAMTLQLARTLGVPEMEVVRAFPDGRSVELDVTRWEELFTSFEELGKVHVIVSNASVTCETVGVFGGFSTWGEFFNVQSGSLDMHIRWGRLGSVFAVEKPSHMEGASPLSAEEAASTPLHQRRATLSFQFFDQQGDSALKVFLNFGGKPSQEQAERWLAARERFGRA